MWKKLDGEVIGVGCRGVWILDPMGEIVASGVQADETVLRPLSDEARRVFEAGRSSSEYTPGGHQWIQMYPIRSGAFTGVVGVWDDRRAEAEIGLEIASMAHDINNLLAVTQGHLELLQMQSENEPASLREALWMLERAEDLVKRLGALGQSRPVARTVDTVVSEGLQHLASWLSNGRHRVELDCDPQLPAVRVDRADFIEIFQNLLQNACEAMPDGGLISVQAKAQPHGVHIAVRDRGPGIASGQMEAIFAPYFTTKETGHGLGLYRTRQLIEQYGGNIQVVSSTGNGSTFIVTLPSAAHSDIIKDSRNTGSR